MNELDFLKEQSFKGSRITKAYSTHFEKSNITHICLRGDFLKGEYPYWDLYFNEIRFSEGKAQLKAYLNDLDCFQGGILKNVEVTPLQKGYDVLLELAAENCAVSMHFFCKEFSASGKKYRGMDYSNVYQEKYPALDAKYAYLFDAKYLQKEERVELTEGYCLIAREYGHKLPKGAQVYGKRTELYKDETCLYAYTNYEGHDRIHKEILHHKNGHRYYAFHVSLYRISYLDLDTLQVYHYVPAGYEHDARWVVGESFIVTDLHYDPERNLIAYGGCYWADCYNVMVGLLEDPLNFDPHLISIRAILDPENERENWDDVDFESWCAEGLNVKTDNGKIELIGNEILLKK